MKRCPECNGPVTGRSDKIYCSYLCRERAYRKSDRGKAIMDKARRKYQQSKKGGATREQYLETPKAKLRQSWSDRKRYRRKKEEAEAKKSVDIEPVGSDAAKRAKAKYRASAKGKATRKQYREQQTVKRQKTAAHREAFPAKETGPKERGVCLFCGKRFTSGIINRDYCDSRCEQDAYRSRKWGGDKE